MAALESWAFLDLVGKEPVFASTVGDVFLRADDGFWWLDTLDGKLSRPWRDLVALRADLDSADGQDQYLLAGLARAAERRGIVPAADEVYDFQHPPVLGGEVDLDNIGTAGFVVSVNIAGQIHGQVRDLPPGTPISGITVDD